MEIQSTLSSKLVREYFKRRKTGFTNEVEIAPWKLDNKLENWLSYRADKSEIWKKIYVYYYRTFDSEYYYKGLVLIDKQIKRYRGNVGRASYKKYVVDMIYSLHRFGAMFDEYFHFRFENLQARGRDQFVTDKLRYAYYEHMNSREVMPVFIEKDKTYQVYKKFFGRDLIKITSEDDYAEFAFFIEKHPEIVIKPYNGASGYGVELVKYCDHESLQSVFSYVLSKGVVVVEEPIKSHPDMRRLYKHSIVGLRVLTVRTREANEILFAVLRCGQNKVFVDNAKSGGIFADIDLKRGLVKTPGYDLDMNQYVAHPDTEVPFVGFQVPMWQELLELVNELADVVPSMRCIGWDLSLSENGWILVEANPGGGIYMAQMPENIGIKSKLDCLVERL